MALFRAGQDEAFRVIYDRYRQRLFAYTRQMLPGRQDAEDALQDVFTRAYSNLRANDRELALRAWLYRVAHNRCVDELRRPAPPPPEAMQFICSPIQDPIAQADQRESLRRLVADVRRLPAQQRSALLMRELGGMPYADLAVALGVSVPAVKSLLVRARMALAQAAQARETACDDIREDLILAHDRRVRPNANARRHMRDCTGCREFRGQLRGVSRQLAALTPALGPLSVLAKVLGVGGSAGGGAAAGSGAAVGAAGTGGALVSAGALTTGAGHIATLIAATVVTAGGAVEIQRTIVPPVHHRVAHRAHKPRAQAPPAAAPAQSASVAPSVAVAAPLPPSAVLPAVASQSATSAIPVKAAVKAVTNVSAVVSTTTKDATKALKPAKTKAKVTPAAGTSDSSTSDPATATTTGSSPGTTSASSTSGSTTATSTSTGSTGTTSPTASGTTSGSSGATSASQTPSSGTPAAGPAAPGTSSTGSGTT